VRSAAHESRGLVPFGAWMRSAVSEGGGNSGWSGEQEGMEKSKRARRRTSDTAKSQDGPGASCSTYPAAQGVRSDPESEEMIAEVNVSTTGWVTYCPVQVRNLQSSKMTSSQAALRPARSDFAAKLASTCHCRIRKENSAGSMLVVVLITPIAAKRASECR
jgi:hypothetical protein